MKVSSCVNGNKIIPEVCEIVDTCGTFNTIVKYAMKLIYLVSTTSISNFLKMYAKKR